MKKTLLLLSLFSMMMFRSFAGGCAFTYQVDSINTLSVSFTYIGWVGPQTYSWDFGDSSTSNLQNPTYAYAAPGSYNVTLNTLDTNGIPCTYNLVVSVGGATNCSFIYSGNNGPAPVTINFTNTSVGPFVNYQWNFGDGSNSSLQSPSHMYNYPGNYNICLVTTDTAGIPCTYCSSINISSNCHANFQYASTGLTAYFVDNSTSPNLSALNYSWDFGDGSQPATTRYPVHTFALPGTYIVGLIIHDSLSCYDLLSDTMVVDTILPIGCNANFLFTELQPFSIDIINTSYGSSISYTWDFGDGNFSSLPYPSHNYASTGDYNICLSINDSTGCSSTFCDSLKVDSLGNITNGFVSGFTATVLSPVDLTNGVSKIENSKISVYPNPAREFFNVKVENANGEYNFTLRTFTGSVCKTDRLAAGKNVIETAHLSSGLYFLEVRNEKGERESWKIIKE